ncbi:MAG: hypothetical protein HUN05_11620 [Desulfobacter sp.]|nr:MAG: hypothetical protein HUN05_11620 [Desulfobacter sp.]
MGWDQAPGQQAPGQKEATQKETGQNSAYPGEMTASERPPVLGNKEVESYHGTPFREMGPSPAKPQVPCDALISPGRDEFKVLGQVLNTYIVVEKENHLVLVDQHAAHERIVYEALKKRHKTIRVQSQTLMVPEIIDLTHKEADILDHALETFAGLGLEIARFGGESFVIKAVPVLVEEKAVKEMVLEMVEQISAAKGGGGEENWLDHCLVTMACHRAVRANQAMNPAEMKTLIADLMDCENPMHCPHGRPILVSFDQRQLEKLFKRLV